jgi:hypothetical protein
MQTCAGHFAADGCGMQQGGSFACLPEVALCVEDGILMLTWYDAIADAAVQKLVMSKWNTAGSLNTVPTETLDWWGDFVFIVTVSDSR